MSSLLRLILQQAVEYKISHPDVRIFSGATDLGVQFNKGKKLVISL